MGEFGTNNPHQTGIGNDFPKVEVKGRHDAGSELKLSKLNGVDVVQAQNKITIVHVKSGW